MASEVGFRCEYADPNDTIPTFVWLGSHPYSGFHYGSIAHVDWGGHFAQGRPHGEFFICFGDRMTAKAMFEHGVEIKTPPGGG